MVFFKAEDLMGFQPSYQGHDMVDGLGAKILPDWG